MSSSNPEKYTKRSIKSSYLSTVISVSLVLFMLGLLGLTILYANKLSIYVKENIGFTVILKEDVKPAIITQFQKSLDASRYVKSTDFITKEEAAKILQQDLGEDFVEFLGYNPLLSSIDVHLKADYANVDSISNIETELLKNEEVKEEGKRILAKHVNNPKSHLTKKKKSNAGGRRATDH